MLESRCRRAPLVLQLRALGDPTQPRAPGPLPARNGTRERPRLGYHCHEFEDYLEHGPIRSEYALGNVGYIVTIRNYRRATGWCTRSTSPWRNCSDAFSAGSGSTIFESSTPASASARAARWKRWNAGAVVIEAHAMAANDRYIQHRPPGYSGIGRGRFACLRSPWGNRRGRRSATHFYLVNSVPYSAISIS